MKTAEIYLEVSCPRCGQKEQVIYTGKEEHRGTTYYAFLCLVCIEEFKMEQTDEKRED